MSNFMEMIEKLQSQLESNIKKEGKEGNEKLPLSSDLLNNQKKNINDGQKDSIVDDSNSFKRKEKERRGGDSDIKPGSSKQSFFSSFSSMTGIGAIIEQAIKKNSIMIFAKSYCPFCNKAEKVFRDDLKVSYYRMDLDKIENGNEIQDELEKKTNQRSVPNIFINGEHIGGCDKTLALKDSGALQEKIKSLKTKEDL